MSGESVTGEGLTWAVNVAAGGPGDCNETGRQINIVATVTVDDGGVPDNPISVENALTGYASANWQVNTNGGGIGDSGALGYTTAMSVQAGSSIDFKIHTGGTGYGLGDHPPRMVWRHGARKVYEVTGRPGVTQPESVAGGTGTGESGTGSRICTSWTVTDTWAVPSDACHGVYLGGDQTHRSGAVRSRRPIRCPYRSFGRPAEILCKLSDMTWRAYNSMGTLAAPTGGKSLYGVWLRCFRRKQSSLEVRATTLRLVTAGCSADLLLEWRASASCLPRAATVSTWLYGIVPRCRCLIPSILLGHKVIVSEGVTTSTGRRTCVTPGTPPSTLASTPSLLPVTRCCGGSACSGRTMFCYKNTHSMNGTGAGIDPVSWTGCWRDTRWSQRRPENESIGTMFVKNGLTSL